MSNILRLGEPRNVLRDPECDVKHRDFVTSSEQETMTRSPRASVQSMIPEKEEGTPGVATQRPGGHRLKGGASAGIDGAL